MSGKVSKRAALAALALAVAALACAAGAATGFTQSLRDRALGLVRSSGRNAWAVFFLVQFAQVIIAPLPGSVLSFTGGALFGFPLASLLSCAAVFAGSVVMFCAGRRFGTKAAVWIAGREAYERLAPKLSGRRAGGALLAAFLLPFFPDDVLCLMAGLTGMTLRSFCGLLAAGRMPSVMMGVLAGAGLNTGRPAVYYALIGAYTGVVLALRFYGRPGSGHPGGKKRLRRGGHEKLRGRRGSFRWRALTRGAQKNSLSQ